MQAHIEAVDQKVGNVDMGCVPSYQLVRESVDVTAMVGYAQDRLVKTRRKAVAAAVNSGAWHEEYPSLVTFPYRKAYKAYSRQAGRSVYPFDSLTGAVNVPNDLINNLGLGEFYTPIRIRSEGDFTQLRGLTYYVSLDRSKDTPQKKLTVIGKDIAEGLDLIDAVDRKKLEPGDYLLYLGVLDYMKSHFSTAFHALTFHERTGDIPEDVNYSFIRQEAAELMLTATRVYYQACIGQPFDKGFNPRKMKERLEGVVDYIAGSSHSAEHFTFAEVSHPLIILLGAHECARRKFRPDVIIGIPSGGTEVAVATALMFENLHPRADVPTLEFVPLSFHYHKQGGIDQNRLAEILSKSTVIEGRNVLVVDDNSNTGSTLQRMVNAIVQAGASNVAVHIAEIDPGRVMFNARKAGVADFGVAQVVNMFHPDFDTAMGVNCALGEDGDDRRRKEASRIAKHAHRQIEKRQEREALTFRG